MNAHSEDCNHLIPITDTLDRPLKDLRISVLDRCNLRCSYCMPEESLHGRGVFLPSHHLLSDGEIELLVRVFTGLGVHKIRLTGGEPLLQLDLPAISALHAAGFEIEEYVVDVGLSVSKFPTPVFFVDCQLSLDLLEGLKILFE